MAYRLLENNLLHDCKRLAQASRFKFANHLHDTTGLVSGHTLEIPVPCCLANFSLLTDLQGLMLPVHAKTPTQLS